MIEDKSGVSALTEKQFRDLVGDPAEWMRNMEKFDCSCDALSAQYEKLLERFPNRWVALYDGEVVAEAGNLPDTIHALKARGFPPRDCLVEFLSARPMTVIL